MKYDVIIIGSGLGGLECGVLLAQCGRSVLVLERQKQAGGCMQSYRRRDSYYDTGLHYVGGLGKGQSLYGAFKALGLLELPWVKLDEQAFDRIMIGERNFCFSQGYDNFTDTLAAEFPSQRKALAAYADLLKNSDEHQLDSLIPLGDSEEDNGAAKRLFDEQFSSGAYRYLCDNFTDPLLVEVLAGASLKMDLDKDSIPLFTFLHGNSGFIQSSWRLCGDGNMLVNALVRKIEYYGGKVQCDTEIKELLEVDGRITEAVASNGERFSADVFISDAHPAVTCSMVSSSALMKNIYKRRIASLENSVGMFTASIKLKPKSVKYFNFNQFIYRDEKVWDLQNRADSVNGVLVCCRPESRRTSSGGTVVDEWTRHIELLTPMPWDLLRQWENTRVGQRGEGYLSLKKKFTNDCIELAERFLPDLRSSISEIYTSTPLSYRDYNLSPNGCAYGIKKNFKAPMLTVLSPKTPVPNLLMTGQSLMLHGLHGVTMTSLFTCAEILGKEKVWNLINL